MASRSKSSLEKADQVAFDIPPIPQGPGRTPIDPVKLLSPIGGEASNGNPQQQVGIYLRYQPLYDQIRQARRQDDTDLSQGVWETDLKVANWNAVESLCIDALSSRTKDIQIASWLTEAWGYLDGVKGLSRGIILIRKLLELYWDVIYPQVEKGDMDQRLQIFSWLNAVLEKRLTLTPITGMGGEPIQRLLTLADWASAEHFQTAILRSEEPGPMVATAVRRGQVTKDIFEIGLQRTTTDFLSETLEDLNLFLSSLDDFKQDLDSYCPEDGLSFNETYETVKNIQSLLIPLFKSREKRAQEKLQATSPASPSYTLQAPSGGEIKDRAQAYQSLLPIAKYLVSIEPHSPTPYILAKIASWEKMSLSQIFQSLSSDPSDYPVIMRMLNLGQNSSE